MSNTVLKPQNYKKKLKADTFPAKNYLAFTNLAHTWHILMIKG